MGDEKVLFGSGCHLALRMTSLLPIPLGAGTRNNAAKREYVMAHVAEIEYRTIPFSTCKEAKEFEKELKSKHGPYRFPS